MVDAGRRLGWAIAAIIVVAVVVFAIRRFAGVIQGRNGGAALLVIGLLSVVLGVLPILGVVLLVVGLAMVIGDKLRRRATA